MRTGASSGGVPGSGRRGMSGISSHPVMLAAVLLLVLYLGFTVIWTALGLFITGPAAESWVTNIDQRFAELLVEHRTPELDLLSAIGSMLAETLVKVIATAVIAVVMLLVWRSWREPFLICAALILEAAVFITVTWIVGRPRPGLAALDEVSVGTSFPSGHAAAAAAYGAMVIVVFERTRNLWVRVVTVTLAVLVPLIVATARMYRGVHYLTDVIAGILLGAACVIGVYLIVLRCFERDGYRGKGSNHAAPSKAAPG